jgi:hypothetical protein
MFFSKNSMTQYCFETIFSLAAIKMSFKCTPLQREGILAEFLQKLKVTLEAEKCQKENL